MIDERDLFERAATWFDPPGDILERMTDRRDRRRRNRRIRSAAVALVVVVLAAVGLAKAFGHVVHRMPAVRPPTGTIVFSRQVSSNEVDYLFTVDSDGVVRPLIPRGFDVFSISPDGSHVLYPDDDPSRGVEEIAPAVVDLDGSHRRILLPSVPMFPHAWSADGTRIVGPGFVAGHSPGLYTASATDGDDQVQVTSPPGRRNDEAIGYSPNGSQILFLRSANNVGANNGRATKDLYVVNVDGSGITRLNPPDTVLGPFDSGVAGTPQSPIWNRRTASWSPDGSSVVSRRPSPHPARPATGKCLGASSWSVLTEQARIRSCRRRRSSTRNGRPTADGSRSPRPTRIVRTSSSSIPTGRGYGRLRVRATDTDRGARCGRRIARRCYSFGTRARASSTRNSGS